MKWRLLKPSVLTPEERLKQDLESRVKTTYYDSGRQSDRFCMEQALNYITRLESELNSLRARGTEQPSNELKLRRIKKMLTAFVTIVHVSPHIQDEKFRDCVKDVLTGTVEELSELELPST